MAQVDTIQSRLQLYFEVGVDLDTGEVITKAKSFNNIKPEATAEQLMNIANALTSLQQFPLHEVRRNDVSLLSEV
ncbi:DUF1659 domain-containing protein [Amphibacillus sp. MSJ-3]|uniref:DUF1659 domain-containing protein n=1 Tax=Amphibacillus sp. MSJ-3 TaxID=2841505 RepID=UPI001C0E990C|nr:DUF1659 domain-containing protein [Amphibacillus sp. MSJ-3]MBU5595459.1 DUF1659 domain-containing protein [Amphibacillus sp. MSJ-3]